jgi:hypothetical protein
MNRRHLNLIIWIAKAAFWLIRALFVFTYRRTGKLFGFFRALKTSDSFRCPGCGAEISLVGRWECAWCKFIFDGFFFSRCNVCGAKPPYIQCQECGTGVRNPLLFP